MTDIIERLKGRALFCRNRGEIKTPELLEEAAQLLQQGEAAAFYCESADGKPENNNAFIGKPVDFAIENAKRNGTKAVLLYRTPPDTQQKLDKAREALQEIVDMHVSSDDGFIAIGIAQQALKDIS